VVVSSRSVSSAPVRRSYPVSSYPAASYPAVKAPVTRYVPASVPTSAPARRLEPSAPAGSIPWKRVSGIQTGDRPLLVWLSETDAGTPGYRAFSDEAVRLGAKAFRTVRIGLAAARAEPYLAAHVRHSPALLVFSPDLGRVRVVVGSALDAASALEAMRSAAKADLGLDLDAAIARARSLQAEEKTVVAQEEALARTWPVDAAKKAEVEKHHAAIRAEQATLFRRPAVAKVH
jgi:hypothetical protein